MHDTGRRIRNCRRFIRYLQPTRELKYISQLCWLPGSIMNPLTTTGWLCSSFTAKTPDASLPTNDNTVISSGRSSGLNYSILSEFSRSKEDFHLNLQYAHSVKKTCISRDRASCLSGISPSFSCIFCRIRRVDEYF